MRFSRFFIVLFILFADVLFVFRQLAFAYVSQSVVLIVLRKVETYLLAEGRHTHRYQTVDEFIACPAHGKGVDKHNDDGQQMIEEDYKAIPCAGDETFLNEMSY